MSGARPSTAATVDSSATRVESTSTTCSPRAAALEPVNPIRRPRAGTNGTLDSAYLPPYFSSEKPPPLDFTFKLRNPILYLLFLLLCNVLIPCVCFCLLDLSHAIQTERQHCGSCCITCQRSVRFLFLVYFRRHYFLLIGPASLQTRISVTKS